jgi:hypothetical protein
MNHSKPGSVKPHRFLNVVRDLLLCALAIAAICGVWFGMQRWYAATHPLEIAWSTMHTTIRNGDSIDDLQRHFGPGRILEPDEVPEWLLGNAHGWPDGFRDGDQFCQWDIEDSTLHFQFREGRLINHNPADYADPDQMFSGVQ